MSEKTKPPQHAGLTVAWIAAANIDLSASLAVGRAAARTLAEISPSAAKALKANLAQEAASLEARGGRESETAATLVRRVLEPEG
jgi:hypothetical protein